MFLRRRGIVNNNAISFGNLLFLAVIDNIIYYIVGTYIMHIMYNVLLCTRVLVQNFEVLFKRIIMHVLYKIGYNIISYIIEVFHIIINNIIKPRRPYIRHLYLISGHKY